MLRAIFLRELCKSLLVHIGLFVTVFGTIAIMGHALSRGPLTPEEERILGFFLLNGLIFTGLISGERCFSLAFKEGHHLFLLTLPRPRGGIWLAYLGGRLAGSLAALPALLLPGLSLVRWLSSLGWLSLLASLSGYLVYFLGSAALALAFRKEILVYLVGFPLLFGFLFLFSLGLSQALPHYIVSVVDLCFPYVRDGLSIHRTPHLQARITCGSLLFALVWAVVSLRAFCRGELHLARRTAQTFAEAGLASATLIGLAALIALSRP